MRLVECSGQLADFQILELREQEGKRVPKSWVDLEEGTGVVWEAVVFATVFVDGVVDSHDCLVDELGLENLEIKDLNEGVHVRL